jgi:nitrate/TMAO reductase-like tetraheme cytochrome c subunit
MAVMALPAEAAKPTTTGALKVESCTDCHNDTTLIAGKHYQWATSLHATGTAFLRGTSASCAGCHSGGAFMDRVLAGLDPNQVTEGDPNPTPQVCRTCHQIHVTFSGADWALETTDPVGLFAVTGTPAFDKGTGNLCVNCHQPRREYPGDPDGDGVVTGISTHWGPHHGPQSAMMLGVGGSVTGFAARHYSTTEAPLADSCVSCHMGPNANHTYEPDVEVCQQCHQTDDFDYHGVQSLTQERLDAIGEALVALGVLSENGADGHPTVSSAPEPIAAALFNWLYVAHEDKSLGVHNPPYTSQLLTTACDNLSIICP